MPPAVADYARSEGEELLSVLSELPRRLAENIAHSIANRATAAGLEVSHEHGSRDRGVDLIVGKVGDDSAQTQSHATARAHGADETAAKGAPGDTGR